MFKFINNIRKGYEQKKVESYESMKKAEADLEKSLEAHQEAVSGLLNMDQELEDERARKKTKDTGDLERVRKEINEMK